GFARRGLFGPVARQTVARLQDLRPRELCILALPALLVLWLGFYPQWLLNRQENTLTLWLQRVYQPAAWVADGTSAERTVARLPGN
ncbi:NADH-quinone oxidoreductase subunit M, partial [Methylomonas sp. WSC-6]|nr:NADH-quinone oxidoreductase subunit M [Methylomonas sp. WSC-6]